LKRRNGEGDGRGSFENDGSIPSGAELSRRKIWRAKYERQKSKINQKAIIEENQWLDQNRAK
jgi:hypothetical protein